MTTGETYPSTSTGRAYRWWGLGVGVFLVLAGIGVLGGVPLIVVGSGDLGGLSTTVEGGPTIRRHCTMGGKHPRPEVGQTLRFRHTTLDPDNLEDALFESIREHR